MLNIEAASNDIFYSNNPHARIDRQVKQIYRHIEQEYPVVSSMDLAIRRASNDTIHCHSGAHPTMIGQFTTSETACFGEQNNTRHYDFSSLLENSALVENIAARAGFKSALCLPIMLDNKLMGITFFSSRKAQAFTEEIVAQLRLYTRVISDLFSNKSDNEFKQLSEAVNAILLMNQVSLAESPQHLKNVASFSGLIARAIAHSHCLTQEWIDYLVLLAPLHDIGKAFLPEGLLNKPGRFTPAEYEQMKAHTTKGRGIIDHMIEVLGYREDRIYTGMLRNIVTHHHETIDGLGYPFGLKGDEIPLEARIVTVADVLDALLAHRVYKKAWSIEETITELKKMAGQKLEKQFVEIIAANIDEVINIRKENVDRNHPFS